ncbi:MAG: hypothetical protein LM590_00800 [Thermofilum sp.]|jgi:hypothetical protein|nr:hypothetical protein [Thermofilum sp.]
MYWVPGSKENEIRSILKSYLYKHFGNLSEQEAEYLFNIAYADFINYVAVTKDIIFDENYQEDTLSVIQYMYLNQPSALINTLTEWIEVWSWKWRQRVKLALRDEEDSQANAEVERKVGAVLPSITSLFNWLKRYTIGALVRHGEVCFTSLLAETIVKEVLFKPLSSQETHEALRFINENPAFIISEITKKVREISTYKGNLVIVRLNPLFFENQRGEPFE